jgi:hypothetical protein
MSLFDGKEGCETNCKPFGAWLQRDNMRGLTTVICDDCNREWCMIEEEVAFAILSPEADSCLSCDPCYDSHCKYCTQAEVNWNGITVTFRKFEPPFESMWPVDENDCGKQ